MDEQKTEIKYVQCQNCTARGKIILPEDTEFDWDIVPCPLCMSDELEEIDRELTEKETDFKFDPTGVEEEPEE